MMSATSYSWAASVRRFRDCLAGLLLVLSAMHFAGCRGAHPRAPGEPHAEPPEPPDGPAWFEDITERVGVNFTHDPGDVSRYLMYQSIGSGCAIHDLDGDGRPEIVLLTSGGPEAKFTNRLFHRKSEGTFEDVSKDSGLDFAGWTMGIAIGDVNNDGKPDLLITEADRARLLLNRGGLRFEDVSERAGIRNPEWGTSCAIVDYDRDGWLDLFIVNYVEYDPSYPCLAPSGERDYCSPAVFAGTVSRLFHNRGGSSPTFEDVTEKSGLAEKRAPGLGVAVADFTDDGWPDFFVANDGRPNHLWINQRDGTFREEGLARGAGRSAGGESFAGMGVALGDVDRDGLLDLYVSHLTTETNTLWLQGPAGQFRDRTTTWGLMASKRRGTGFGTVVADFDLDGQLDIAVVNGRVTREQFPRRKPGLRAHWEPYAERNQVFANAGKSFRDVSHNNPAFCGYFTVARGLACGDIDGDGAPDLLINAIGERARLLRNVAPGRGHWIGVRALEGRSNRDAVGAVVEARAGGTSHQRPITSSEGFLSAGPALAHFGLGNESLVEEFTVRWPDGTRERFPGAVADRVVELRKGMSKSERP